MTRLSWSDLCRNRGTYRCPRGALTRGSVQPLRAAERAVSTAVGPTSATPRDSAPSCRSDGTQVLAGRRPRGVAQRGLDQVDRGTAVERVAGVGVAQPVGRHGQVDAGPFGRSPDDPQDLDRAQVAATAAGGE